MTSGRACTADDPTEGSFRAEVRAFIAHNAPRATFDEGLRVPRDPEEEKAIRSWLGSLYAAGYLGAGWPKAWGGQEGHRPTRDLILMEELFRARAYRPLDQVLFAGHAILSFGSEDQKRTYLPRIRSGDHIWCQLFSEPGAGSDLASLKTRAEPEGDEFIVTGQKVWCTDAQWADMGLLLARTDPTTNRHAGLTAFVVPMESPGLSVRPIREITGSEEFCEVFLDGVRLGPEHVLGSVGEGWPVITSGLASERAFVGANAVQLDLMFQDLVELARCARLADGDAAIDQEDVQNTLAAMLSKVSATKRIVEDTVERILFDEEHPSDGPLAKLAYTERYVELCETALELISNTTSFAGGGRALADRWYANFLWSRALTISGGASEVLRGLLARQLLDLPRA